MSTCELPTNRCKTALEDLAHKEGFDKYEISVTKPLAPGENHLGEIYRVVITGNKYGKPESLKLIVKTSLQIEKASTLMKCIFKWEACVYNTLLPIVDEYQKVFPENGRFTLPKLYGTILEEDDDIIIMEDMCHKDYRMLDRMQSFSYEQLVLCVKNIARFHATSFILKAKQPKIYEELCDNSKECQPLKDVFKKVMFANTLSLRPHIEGKANIKAFEAIIDRYSEYYNLYDSDKKDPYSILIHGDTWNNNFLFKYKDGKIDDIVMIDWQMTRNASPVVEISYLFFIGIDSNMRSKHYDEMLDLYYDTLSANLKKMGGDVSKQYPQSVFREHVRKFMKYGLVFGLGVLQLTLSTNKDDVDYESFGEETYENEVSLSKTCIVRVRELLADCVEMKIL